MKSKKEILQYHQLYKIPIPDFGIEEIHNYKKGIIGILGKIEIDINDELMKENLMSVYKLLNHLSQDKTKEEPGYEN
jgi:hypothetical protein